VVGGGGAHLIMLEDTNTLTVHDAFAITQCGQQRRQLASMPGLKKEFIQ
jgi:hypothetical protein